jgi:indolepyruvate ferredoxin oxidoreductase alpha subunit
MIIMDNRITAMTGHQTNPGMGKTITQDPAPELQIADIVKACGVKNIKVLDPINQKELEETLKNFWKSLIYL